MVRVRFAPSPTGYLHIGSLRTALYNYLFAKSNNGKFIIRIEDTDQTRYVEDAVQKLIASMNITGIFHDEGPFIKDDGIYEKGEFGPYVQSKRLDIYKKYIEELLEKGWAYYCFCSKERLDEVREQQKIKAETPKYDGHCRNLSQEEVNEKINNGEPYVIRLKLPENKIVAFDDIVRGHVEFNTNDIDDQVLIKSDGFPTYHFAVVVDDHLMEITHVFRGEEWLSSTPKQILLYEAFEWDIPKFVHLPTVLNENKKKLSKRQGDVAVEDFLSKGYLPEALVNFIALLGWSPNGDQEILSIEDLIDEFDLSRINKSGAVFDVSKLNWMNSHYIKKKTNEELTELCIPYLLEAGYISSKDLIERKEWVQLVVASAKEKLNYLSEITKIVKVIFEKEVIFESEECNEILRGETVPILMESLREKLRDNVTLDLQRAKGILKEIQKEKGIKGKNLFMPTRVMLTGQVHGPDLLMIMVILGSKEIINRIEKAQKSI